MSKVSWIGSAFLALLIGGSIELISHRSAGAMFGNGVAITLYVIGALVIHAIRVSTPDDEQKYWYGSTFLILLAALYIHYDEKYFSAHRPWNLFLVALFVAGALVVLVGFVAALLRMFEIDSERAMGKACLGLTPIGLGILLSMIWGWRILFRDGSPIPDDKRGQHLKLMSGWTAGLVVQAGVLGYIWYYSPAHRSILTPFTKPPIAVHTAVAAEGETGVFFRVRVVNTSSEPLYNVSWAAFPGEEWRVKQENRQIARWHLIELIQPGSHCDLPELYDVGWVFEFDCGDQGIKVYRLDGSGGF